MSGLKASLRPGATNRRDAVSPDATGEGGSGRDLGLFQRTMGPDQADRYVGNLFACFARAVETPEAGRDRSGFVPGARSMQSGRHLVFYRQTEQGVVILRIVHEARNWAALRFADGLG